MIPLPPGRLRNALAPLRGKVAPWWIPDEVIRVTRMRLSPTGKIDKVRLRMEYGSA